MMQVCKFHENNLFKGFFNIGAEKLNSVQEDEIKKHMSLKEELVLRVEVGHISAKLGDGITSSNINT